MDHKVCFALTTQQETASDWVHPGPSMVTTTHGVRSEYIVSLWADHMVMV